jgi:hypothetical protein
MEGIPAPGGIASPRSVSRGAGRVIRQDSSLGQKQLNGARGRAPSRIFGQAARSHQADSAAWQLFDLSDKNAAKRRLRPPVPDYYFDSLACTRLAPACLGSVESINGSGVFLSPSSASRRLRS